MGIRGIDTDTIEHNGLGILGKNHFKAIKCDRNDVKVACFLKNLCASNLCPDRLLQGHKVWTNQIESAMD